MENKIEEKKVENKVEVEKKESVIKGFQIIEKNGQRGVYYQLEVETYLGRKVTMFLSETQKEVIDIVGLDNCHCDIALRTSKENRKYGVIALAVGDDTFDFFPKDRAFITLAKLHYKKHISK